MARVKRGVIKNKTRKNTLARVKGFRFGRGSKKKQANEAIPHAGVHAFRDRRDKKGVNRRIFQVRINAAVRPLGYSYSKFIDTLKKKNIELDRKVLSEMAAQNPESFARLVKSL